MGRARLEAFTLHQTVLGTVPSTVKCYSVNGAYVDIPNHSKWGEEATCIHVTGIYFGANTKANTSREYCQCNHDQRNASIVYSIKSKSLIITNSGDVRWVYVELQQLRETYSVKAETFANVTVLRLHV